MKKILQQLDRVFNRFFTSKFNPLYNSGTIAVGLLAIALATGLILCFFYRLGEPYESVLALQNNPWFGSWVRSTHRYASDAMVAVVLVHILRMFAQGKSWGPRTLAWLSGVLLMLFMLVSGWTGFVLVWDMQGQAVAAAGAKIMDALGIFSDPISRSFDGSSLPPASFFFFNLFMHIVIPLAMIFGLWLHTSRMANAVWLPGKSLMRGMTAAIVLVAMISPAALNDKADLLMLPKAIPLDWFYNFWLPWTALHPQAVFLTFALAVTLLASAPWWNKPKVELRPLKSFNDQKRCQGCAQCVQDCPYEAISMVTRSQGLGSELVARVNSDLCVSCGLCAASCVPFTMGPPERKGTEQFSAARLFLTSLKAKSIEPGAQVLIVGCHQQQGVSEKLRALAGPDSGFQFYPVGCTGTLHATVFEHFAKNFRSVAVVACPERNCTNKDGHLLLRERLSGVREPTFEHESNGRKVQLFSAGEGEENGLIRQLNALQRGTVPPPGDGIVGPALAFFTAIVLLLGFALLTRISSHPIAGDGLLRLSLRLSGQSEKKCRARTEEELRALPQHMRTPEICDSRPLTYRLLVSVDAKTLRDEKVRPGGLHSDRPIYVEHDLEVTPGPHDVEVTFAPIDDPSGKAITLSLQRNLRIGHGRVVLLHTSADQKTLLVKGDEG